LTTLAALLSIASGAYMVAYQEKASSVPAAFDVVLNGVGGYFVAQGLLMLATVADWRRSKGRRAETDDPSG